MSNENINNKLKKILIDYNFTLNGKNEQLKNNLLTEEQHLKECDLITSECIERIKIILKWKM